MMHAALPQRSMHRLRAMMALAACAMAPFAASAKEIDCPNFPEPRAKLQWVAPYMVFNGVPMQIKRFDAEQSPDAILAFYRQAWKSAKPADAPQEYMSGPWQTIAVMRGKCFFTVQVQASGRSGSTGLLSASQVQDKPTVVQTTWPMMSGSAVINDIAHMDEGKTARTVLLNNAFSAESNADFYRRQLGEQGWQTLSSFTMKTKKGPGITMVMKRGLAEANLVITREGQHTVVLANLVENP